MMNYVHRAHDGNVLIMRGFDNPRVRVNMEEPQPHDSQNWIIEVIEPSDY